MHSPRSRSKRKNRGRPGSPTRHTLRGPGGASGGPGEFATRAGEKMREQGSFAHTSPFRPPPHFSRGVVVPLRKPTADPRSLVAAACAGIRLICEPGYQIQKAGVILLDLAVSSIHQAELDMGDIYAGQSGPGETMHHFEGKRFRARCEVHQHTIAFK